MNTSLIEFSIENFASFKDRKTFSLVADALKENTENTFKLDNDLSLLKVGVLYGANASGKTKLLKGLELLKYKLLTSANLDSPHKISCKKFLFSLDSSSKPSFFEVVLSVDSKKYRYNFSLGKGDKVLEENLFTILKTTEKLNFSRKNKVININDFKEGEGFEKNMRPETLFISTMAQLNGSISTKIINSFRQLNVIDGTDSSGYAAYTRNKFQKEKKELTDEEKDFCNKVINVMHSVDFGIGNIYAVKEEVSPDASPFKVQVNGRDVGGVVNKITFVAEHKVFGLNQEEVGSELLELNRESHGTQRMFDLAGPIIDSLLNGKILFIDELNASLHPFLCEFIVSLFNSEFNKNNAQLVFTTHDSNMLNHEGLRRDQFWFIQKDKFGVSDLFSLSEFKERNNTTNFEKHYLQGRYGAVPFVDSSILGK